MSTVLVTGGSGFIGSHCILQLLEKGHEVRTTVRNLSREPEVRAMLKAGGAEPGSRLSFFAAIGYGQGVRAKPFDETDWTNLEGDDITPYTKSKTIAERAAWDFIEREGNGLELAVVNPVGVLGPVLGPDFSTSIQIVKGLMDGAMPGCPKLGFGLVDVRDVADLHIRAMTDPAAKGERFLAISGDFVWMRDVALFLKERLGKAAAKVPTRQLPNWLVFIAALRMPEVKLLLPELGKEKHATGAKAGRVLGWQPRSWQQSAVDTAESLAKLDA